MMKTRLVFAAGALATLSACASAPPAAGPSAGPAAPSPPVASAPAAPTGTIEFRTSDFAWSTAPGRGSIDGQLVYRAGRQAYTCEDAGVVLTPETAWVQRRMTILYTNAERAALPAADVRGRTPPERSQDYSAFVKRATCDAAGKFSFTGLPDGAWYAITVAKPTGGAAGTEMAIMRRVVIRDGRAVRVEL